MSLQLETKTTKAIKTKLKIKMKMRMNQCMSMTTDKTITVYFVVIRVECQGYFNYGFSTTMVCAFILQPAEY